MLLKLVIAYFTHHFHTYFRDNSKKKKWVEKYAEGSIGLKWKSRVPFTPATHAEAKVLFCLF